VVCDEHGLAVFERLRYQRGGRDVFLFAFDLLELDGADLRREPFETRKATLASLLRGSLSGVRLNEHLTHPGDVVFRHACKMGLEGIVSKRLGSRYRSGRSPDWLKFKNPDAPAVKREAEEVGCQPAQTGSPPSSWLDRWEPQAARQTFPVGKPIYSGEKFSKGAPLAAAPPTEMR
jgi:hypothetical protein